MSHSASRPADVPRVEPDALGLPPWVADLDEHVATDPVDRGVLIRSSRLGALPGAKVGTTWAVPASAVEALRSRRRPACARTAQNADAQTLQTTA